MYILDIISISVIAFSGLFAAARHLMYFQQSSYYLKRYLNWLKGARGFRTFISLVLFALSVLFTVLEWHIPLCILAVLSLVRIKTMITDKQKAIKKLVVTARVKRQIFTMSLLFVIFVFIGAAFCRYSYLVSILLSFCTPILLILSAVINKPIEKLSARYYINDAKKILKAHKGLKVIGITGSYGKTGTKFILNRILSESFNVLATPESFNTPMGIVRTVREKMTAPTEIFIAEMGAKQKGDIKEICKIANPDIALITSVGPQHLDTFGSIENVLKTKLELADWVRKKGGKSYFNSDNEYLSVKKEEYGAVAFGSGENAEVRAENISYGPSGLDFEIVKGEKRIKLHTSLLGRHNAMNITAAVAVALDLGQKAEDIAFAVSTLRPVEHRLQMRPYVNGSVLIDDAYNSNPAGCIEAVNVLASFEGMRKIIVTPGLVELGEMEYECNKNLGIAAAEKSDEIILVGKKRSIPLMDGIKEVDFKGKVTVVEKFSDAAALLAKTIDNNSVVLFENDLPDNYLG